MNRKKTLITWAILLAVEAAIVLLVAGFELSSRGGGQFLRHPVSFSHADAPVFPEQGARGQQNDLL